MRFTVTLNTFNFENSGFKSPWGVDVDLYVYITGVGGVVTYDIPDIAGNYKNNPSHNYLKNRLNGLGGISRPNCFATIEGCVTTDFQNYNCRNDKGSATVEFAYILAQAMDSGECDIDFESASSRRPNAGKGYVRIKFTELPRY